MKVDILTKILLGIIAINLTILSLSRFDLIPEVQASEPSIIKNLGSKYSLIPLNEDGSINVKLSNNNKIDVNITDISTNDNLNINVANISTMSEFPVVIEDIDSWAFDDCTVPVKIKN